MRTRTATRGTAQGFCISNAPTPTAGFGKWMSTRCRQASGGWGRANRAGPAHSTSRMRAATDTWHHHPAIRPKSISTGHTISRLLFASPVAGTPQGLAVYQNGARITKRSATPSLGLDSDAAIRSVTVVTNNPAFGLNALAGPLSADEDGFNYRAPKSHDGGSFGRIQSSAHGASRSTIFPSMGGGGTARPAEFRIFLNRRSAVLWGCRLQTTAANSISTGPSPDNNFGAECDGAGRIAPESIGREPIRHRRSRPNRLATST